jgi:hypothetical protein
MSRPNVAPYPSRNEAGEAKAAAAAALRPYPAPANAASAGARSSRLEESSGDRSARASTSRDLLLRLQPAAVGEHLGDLHRGWLKPKQKVA